MRQPAWPLSGFEALSLLYSNSMRFFRKVLPWLIVALAIALALYIPDIGPEKYTSLDILFANEAKRQANAGFSVAIAQNGRIIYRQSFGKDGKGQPISDDTPMYLGPSSEILSGALLYAMTLQKKVSLDVNIKEYLPDLPPFSVKSLRQVEALDKTIAPSAQSDAALLTLRMLASHTVDLNNPALARFASQISGLEAGEFNPEQFIRSRIANRGTTRSRLVYRIVGLAMEKAGNASFNELLQSNLLIPLGMHATTADPESLQGIAVGAGFFFGLSFPYSSQVPEIAAPADGIVTTAHDIAKFLAYITSPPARGIPALPASSVTNLYQPLLPGGDTGFGWRIAESSGNRSVYQGGSIEGFSSRVVIWPERNTGIAILSSQGGVIQSNIVLPLLASAAEKVLFEGASPRLFPLERLMVIAGIAALVFIISLFLQTATSHSWARVFLEHQEGSTSFFARNFALFRTVAGIAARGFLLVAAPLFIGKVVGRQLVYHDLLVMDPGAASFFIILFAAGIIRNLARIAWVVHLKRG